MLLIKNKAHRRPVIFVPSLLLSFLLICGYAQAQSTQEGEEEEDAAAVRAALADQNAGKIYEGLWKLKQVLRRNPNFADAYFYLGMIYTRMRQYDLALRYVHKAIELDPEKGAYHNQVGVILVQQGKFQEALKEFQAAAERKLETEREKVWRNIGYMHKDLLQWDEAIGAFQTALELQPRDSETHFALGNVYMDRNRLEEAIREFAVAVQLEPKWAEAHAFLGMAYSRANRLAEAEEVFRKAAALDPEDHLTHYNLAQILIKLGQTEEGQKELEKFKNLQKKTQEIEHHSFVVGSTFKTALEKLNEEKPEEATKLLQQVLILDNSFVPALYTLGFTLLKQEEYERAITSLQQAVTLDPLNAGAYFYLGLAYIQTGKLIQALEATERAIVIYEEDAKYHNQLGEIYLALNQKEEAQRAFEQALNLDERFFLARLNLGSLALQELKIDEALTHLRVAVDLDRTNAEARRLLGLAYFENSQYQKSIEQYREAIRLSPGEERLRMVLAEALIQVKRFPDAEQALKGWIEVNPGSGQAHYNLGTLYYTQGRFQEALGEFQKAIELKAEVGLDRVYTKMGNTYSYQIKFKDAIASYRKALEINPNLLEAHAALGDLYIRRNRYDDALTELLAAVALDPNPKQVEVYAQLGQVYLRMGRYPQALQALQKALELDPYYRSARYTLAQVLIHLGKTQEGQEELQRFQQMQAEAQTQEHCKRELVALSQEASSNQQKGDYDKAIVLFRKASECDPRAGLPYLNLGLALMRMARHEEAVKNLQKAVELNFDFPEVHYYLAEQYKFLGKLEESEKEKVIYTRMREERWKAKRENP